MSSADECFCLDTNASTDVAAPDDKWSLKVVNLGGIRMKARNAYRYPEADSTSSAAGQNETALTRVGDDDAKRYPSRTKR